MRVKPLHRQMHSPEREEFEALILRRSMEFTQHTRRRRALAVLAGSAVGLAAAVLVLAVIAAVLS